MASSDKNVKTTKEMEVVEEQRMIPGSEEWEEYWEGMEERLAARSECGGVRKKKPAKGQRTIDGMTMDWPYAPAWEPAADDDFPAPNRWAAVIDSLKARAKKGDAQAIAELEKVWSKELTEEEVKKKGVVAVD